MEYENEFEGITEVSSCRGCGAVCGKSSLTACWGETNNSPRTFHLCEARDWFIYNVTRYFNIWMNVCFGLKMCKLTVKMKTNMSTVISKICFIFNWSSDPMDYSLMISRQNRVSNHLHNVMSSRYQDRCSVFWTVVGFMDTYIEWFLARQTQTSSFHFLSWRWMQKRFFVCNLQAKLK